MNRTVLAAVAAISVAATILAQSPVPATTPSTQPAAEEAKKLDPALRKLSRRERKERMQKLEIKHQDFLTDVEPIMLQTELDTFLTLETDAQRDSFIDEFWRRRDALQGAANRAFRETYYARLDVAKEQFRLVKSDRSKMFLLHGPPEAVVRIECPRVLQPIEIWKYSFIKGFGHGLRILFYKSRNTNEYRLWNPIGGNMALSELLTEEGRSLGPTPVDMAERAPRGAPQNAPSLSPYNYMNRVQLECKDADEVMRAIGGMVQNRVDLIKLFEPPAVSEDEVQKILRSMVIANPKAPKLSAEFSVRYPAKDGGRTDVQMMLLVPRAEVTPAEVGGAEVYTLDVTGEVLKDGDLWEKYRYRFDFPGDFKGDKLPIVVDRLLRPATYTSRIKVTDANTGAEAVVEQPITVPEIFTPDAPAQPKVASATPALPAPTVADLKAAVDPKEARLRIVPPDGDMISGMQTIETIASGASIKAVEFWFDGRRIAVRRAPPYSLDLDFGQVPQTRRIRAVALDGEDKPITGDEITVNTGTDPFRVRIVSPRIAPKLSGQTRVEIAVDVPDGEQLDNVELYWNTNRVATMFDAPFVQTVDIPATEGVGYLRALARLKDPEATAVEDVVLLNTPAYMEELNVHLIELPATVTVKGKPLNTLTEKAFQIFDEGKPVSIAKFEYVKNLPLSIGMAMDTSGSMQQRMDEAQKAGAQFFQNVLRKGDKAFLVAFDTEPAVVQKWSTKLADMQAGLAKLRAEESTALYDAIVYSLYNFLGVKGQKALVVISDGKDTASKFTFDQALDYARRSAVPIYAIGIGIKANDHDVRFRLNRFTAETGGGSYYIENAKELERVYDDIQNELRSQYVLGFYPAPDIKPGGKWRELEVKVAEGKVKTIRGYYP
jgi:Ca-activated chloride channel homolog